VDKTARVVLVLMALTVIAVSAFCLYALLNLPEPS
jgi:hypothetical protein